MLSYTLRRLLMTLPVMLFVALFVFGLLDLAPGDPAALLAGEDATPQDIARIRATLGLDQPFLHRFGEWGWSVLHGDLGTSLFTGLPVSHMIGQRLVPTFSLMVMTLIVSVVVAIPIGALAAWKHNRLQDRGIMVLAVFSFSVPSFAVGYLLAWIFGLQLRWFPVQGYAPLSAGFWASVHTLVLPALALGSVYVALITRITRATLLETLSQDYVRTARAKGLPETAVFFGHVLRNALIPILTGVVVVIPLLFMGSLLTESFFGIPGLGSYTIDAINAQDFAVVRAMVFIGSVLYIAGLILTDISYTLVDPRIRFQ